MARWIVLAGNFPPTLNKEDDPSTLNPNETPDAYGVDMTADGYLKSGSIPTGTARSPETNTFAGKSWEYYHNRSWYDTGATLHYTAPYYNDYDVRQGVGKLGANDTIQDFMPAFGADMWVCTAKGSHMIRGTIDQRGFYNMDEFRRELKATGDNRCLVVDGQPIVSNTSGVFRFDGRATTELTRSIRGNLGNFSNKPITADYQNKRLVGDSNFAIDLNNGNLYDYGTSGFRFQSRTIAQPRSSYRPFTVQSVAFEYEMTTPANGATIDFETKIEDGDWEEEEQVVIEDLENQRTKMIVPLERSVRTGRRMALRITSIDSNIKLKQIELLVDELADNAYTE